MEVNFDEDISELKYSELIKRKERFSRDKRFVSDKVIFWNKQYSMLRKFEQRLVKMIDKIRNRCELCGYEHDPKNKDEKPLKNLPTGERVCGHCYKKYLEEIRIKNYNNQMRAVPL